MTFKETVEVGGRTLTLETGKIAKQADGAVWVTYGESCVLVTAVSEKKQSRETDFFPLTVNYQEKIYAIGKIPGGFIKRETRPHDDETLTSRLIDRPLRPLFPDGYKNETQIIANVFSADMVNDTRTMAMIGASAALHVSDVPWQGPIAGIRVVKKDPDSEMLANPPIDEVKGAYINLFVACSKDAIVMVEGESEEAGEEEMVNALMFAFENAQPVIQAQERLREKAGKAKREFVSPTFDPELKAKVEEVAMPGIREAYEIKEKLPRYARIGEAKQAVKDALGDEVFADNKLAIGEILEELKYHYVRDMIVNKRIRIDGRNFTEVRPITIETGVLPRVHGSALFTRGETQSLVITTLGTGREGQRIDDMYGDRMKNFFLHYSFPPFCVGEIKRIGSPGRREIGHGRLAERSLRKMIPDLETDFPYTIRVASEIMESNGSSSMATVCGGSLSMFDAGVPMKKAVAGVAMGLIEEGDKIVVLTDILGDEDHLGDMDFKVTGTKDGICAIQMDIKLTGVSREVLADALDQARAGRLHILGKMEEAIAAPREELSAHAPRMYTIHINPDRIRDVIGAGGKTIREITQQTGCDIDLDDNGTVTIGSPNEKQAQEAIDIINGLTEEPEIGKVYNGRVKKITDFGAFVEIIPGIEGLLHISEVAWERTDSMEGVMKEGEIIEVKLVDMERNGKMRLSKKALLPKPEGWEPPPRREPSSSNNNNRRRNDRGPRGGGNRGGNRR